MWQNNSEPLERLMLVGLLRAQSQTNAAILNIGRLENGPIDTEAIGVRKQPDIACR